MRRWDKRGGGPAPGGPGARGTLQGPCPAGRAARGWGGAGAPSGSWPPATLMRRAPAGPAPSWRAGREGVRSGLGPGQVGAWLPQGAACTGTAHNCFQDSVLPAADPYPGLCVHSAVVEGLALHGPPSPHTHTPSWVPAVAQSLQGPMGGHAWLGRCQERGWHREMGKRREQLLPAPAAGPHSTRDEHLGTRVHARARVCVSLADTLHTWDGHIHCARVHAHTRYPVAMQEVCCVCAHTHSMPPHPHIYSTVPPHQPPHHSTLLGGCGCPHGWPGSTSKAGHSCKQHGHGSMLLPAPWWGRRAEEHFRPGWR
nr:PREDICTED: uncharacterized protein LOC106484932 [Apteryx mantelli mantelli]